MIKAHIVNHTHWDREWYFTSGDALVLSEQLFTDVIDELERNPDVTNNAITNSFSLFA